LSISPAGFAVSHTLTFPADFFKGATSEIVVSYVGTDVAGNQTAVQTVTIKVDITAPDAVKGLTTFINTDGSVTISWINPPAGTFKGLYVLRDGVIIATLGTNQTTFTDNTTVLGQVYSYSIVAFDEALNTTALSPTASVSIPAPVVAAAVSDTNSYVAPTDTNTNTGTDTAVKANVTHDDKANSDNSGFPLWGIILLVILALVGGYLIWNQKPALEPVAPVETKKKTTTTKKK
jgi:hypothetical protein